MHSFYYLLTCLATCSFTHASPQYPPGYNHPSSSSGSSSSSSNVVATAAPSPSRGTMPSGTGSGVCDARSIASLGVYTLMANIWNTSPGPGSQCASPLSGGSGSPASWTTTWSWSVGRDIKSFANANGNSLTPCKPPNSMSSISSTWNWEYSTSDIVADVAYDIFLGGACNQPGGGHAYEIMIWLGVFGNLGPIDAGNGVKSYTDKTTGTSWTVHTGSNPANGIGTVYSFLPTGGNLQNFNNANLLPFIEYLASFDAGVGTTTLVSIQAGTEAVMVNSPGASATFTTSAYEISGS